uniref:ST3 beta-galactoside alpha-2,3-sialyltransferase 3b n=1 Tax=Oncorhynchus mykiss TaxID=8022 RepID=A0A8K9XC60_ONCMY
MKPSHKLLFVLCPMLVLGFIYYSSGKLHLHVWGQKPQLEAEIALTVGRIVGSVYDKQGFLLKLDGQLPAELAYKYGNLSEGVCKPGYAAAKMTAIYPKFMKPAPMFLDRNFKRLAKVRNYLPPFGFKTQERIIDSILTATKNYGLGEVLDSLGCKRCIIVGNGGILANKSLGSRIDDYDIVVRLNEAPVTGFGKDVGTKTTMRITYPEGAIQKPERYEKDSLFVFSAFKPLDFKWLRQMVYKEKLRGTEGFWKSVAHYVPREPTEMRILNPYFIQEAAFQFIGLPLNNGLMGKGVSDTRTETRSSLMKILNWEECPEKKTCMMLCLRKMACLQSPGFRWIRFSSVCSLHANIYADMHSHIQYKMHRLLLTFFKFKNTNTGTP